MLEKLFEPGKIGSMMVKNRIVMAPMGTGALQNPDGGFSERVRDYFEARAKGGVGLIMTGSTLMTRVTESELRKSLSTLFLDRTFVGGASETVDAVHRYEAKICIQLAAGDGRLWSFGPSVVAPSAGLRGVFDPSIISRAATTEEVEKIVEDYAYVAGLVREAGFDAIEIRGYGGYFTDQFMTALWNKRTDKYGGDLEGRLRFPMEIIKAIRKACGEDYPLIFKFTPVHGFEGGRNLQEGLEIARRLQDAGVDALHVDYGAWENHYDVIPPIHQPLANQIWVAEKVKKAVNIPVIAQGKLGINPEIAASVLKEEKTDFVGLGRSLLADPEWPSKVREGRLREIKTCIGCQSCLTRLLAGKYISCAVNPQTGMEREYKLLPAEHRKSVIVIGGGPAGAEAAITASLRGHKVTLFEKGTAIGGQLFSASAPSFKKQMQMLIDYYSIKLSIAGVIVKLGKEMDVGTILESKPDVVVVATGANPVLPEQLASISQENIWPSEKILLGQGIDELGKGVVIIGGGEVGCETALYLVEKARNLTITIVEQLEELAHDAYHITKLLLQKKIKESAVKVLCNTKFLEIGVGGVTVNERGSNRKIDADSVILAIGYKSNDTLSKELEGKVKEIFTIGDSKKPRKVLDAIWEGFHTARMI